jgi:outer membrane lipase/esterase
MKNRYLRLLAFLSGCLIATISPLASAGPFTGLVVFGDSLSDSGNNAFVFDNVLGPPLPAGSLRTPVPIPGPDFVPTYPYASGRYTNGPVWAELLASNLGLAAAPSMAGGSNFAFGGARLGPALGSFPYSLVEQTTMFLGQNGGRAPSGNLYVLQDGNDARDALALLADGGDPTPLISAFGNNIAALLARMQAAGADHILVMNIPDLGTAPAVQALGPAAAAAATGITIGFNTALESSLSQLAASAANNIQLLDLFDLQQRIFSNPAAFGFSDLTSACAFSVTCIADPAATFFWDGIHPTASVHAVIGNAALALIPLPIPLPGTGPLLGLGLLILVLGRRLRQSA